MFIPIGHDQLTLRRLPVVCFAIMALCVLVFIAGSLEPRPDPKDVREKLHAALTYLVEHPYLEANPRLRQVLDWTVAEQDPEDQQRIRDRLGATHDHEPALDTERQGHLDELTDAWIAAQQVGQTWRLGLVPARFEPSRLLTHLFVHLEVLHLLFNMLFLYLSGPSLEDVWGRPMFALFYLLAGTVSAGAFVALYPQVGVPLVGASGAIAACMGAFFVRFPRADIRLFYVWMLRVGTTTMPAWVALLLWVVGELFSAFVTDQMAPGTGGAGVAHWGHIAGFAFGVVFALGARAVGLEERVDAQAVGDDRSWNAANRALASGRSEDAWRLLRERLVQHPSDDDAVMAYWSLAEQLGRSREAAPAMLRLVRGALERGDQETALRQWDEVKERCPDVAPSIDLAVRLAAAVLERGSRPEAIDLLRGALGRVDAATPAQVLADLATVAAYADAALAGEAAARALRHPALPREARAALERLAADGPIGRVVTG
ncbi:MAG TPA: rhomboid family intramembrane serine protease [Candidatus Binatia bacterium]